MEGLYLKRKTALMDIPVVVWVQGEQPQPLKNPRQGYQKVQHLSASITPMVITRILTLIGLIVLEICIVVISFLELISEYIMLLMRLSQAIQMY
ncbi:hypothetical protein KU75_25420 [Pectobacterium odoriferum]|uniref:Uncharacterized protein n=1 Tax=Pectobacterium odoriferum TaxID=78398 RepID=A0ABR4VI00_9GAMM|nr:hypothetical protein KU75_25420 [Pectobacterium odoriferum]